MDGSKRVTGERRERKRRKVWEEMSRWINFKKEENVAMKEGVQVTNKALFTICHAVDVLGIKASVHIKEAASL